MPEHRAVLLGEFHPHLFAMHVVTFGEIEGDDTVRVAGDDRLAFNPWNGVEAHRPLGSIMRVRKLAYESSSRQRHDLNAVARREPDSLADLTA